MYRGERALTPGVRRVHSLRNSFHSAMSKALRMSAVSGGSFGARDVESSFSPASCGRRLPLCEFTSLFDYTRFSHVFAPCVNEAPRGRTGQMGHPPGTRLSRC